MRLYTRRVWRAIPELDAFDDGLCRRFVKAATASWRGRLARGLVLLLIGIPTVALAGGAAIAIDDAVRSRAGVVLSVVAFALIMCCGAGVAFWVRRRLLRRSIRRLIRDRGSCPGCGYVILGQAIDSAGTVRCPECGMSTHADASVGEASDAGGEQRVFMAVLPRLDVRGVRRRRIAARVIGWGGGALVCVALIGYAGFVLWLYSMARQARAERGAAQAWRELVAASMPIPGAETGGDAAIADGPNEWETYVRVVESFSSASKGYVAERKAAAPAGEEPPSLDFTSTLPAPARVARRSKPPTAEQAAMDARQKAFAEEAMRTLVQTDAAKDLSRLRSIRVAIMTVPETASTAETLPPPLIEVLLPELGLSRNAARFNAARMEMALRAQDLDRYVDALDQSMALARICAAQPTVIQSLVGVAIEAMMLRQIQRQAWAYPDARWTRAVQGVLEGRPATVRTSRMIEGERMWARDTVQWFFAQPWKVQRAMALGRLPGLLGSAGGPNWFGTYEANLRDIDAMYAGWKAYADLEPFARGAVPRVSSSLPLVNLMMPAFSKSVQSADQISVQRRGVAWLLGVRHFEQRTGRLPANLDELTNEDIRERPVDPFTGKAFGYTLNDPQSWAPKRPFVLYSAGGDGKDDGGNDGGVSWYTIARQGVGPGSDVVINDPVE